MKIFSNSPSEKKKRRRKIQSPPPPPNGYLSISQPFIAFHIVKFRKLQINYILFFSRKIFQLKTAQSQRALHFEANFVIELKAYDTS